MTAALALAAFALGAAAGLLVGILLCIGLAVWLFTASERAR